MTQGNFRDRAGATVHADLVAQLISHLRVDEMELLLSATSICKDCSHLYLFHDEEGYCPCKVESCECVDD